ncbi:MAG: hypothetical protein SOZ65_00440 [Erysipelotrichaceae bacterium]|nr:hypothetical protein [Erysipelotrichaceae bacterium]
MMASNYQRKLKLLQSKQSLAIKLVICLILLLMISVGGTIAFVVTHTSEIRNTFTESVVKCEVDETFKDNVKSNVSIKNTGDTTAYIRAFVNVTWMNESGQVASVSPKSTDYMIEYSTSGWLKGSDGYYYYSLPVQPNDKTAVLINSCQLLETASAPDGYYLSVEIVCSAIQSTPVSVVKDIWHVQLSGSEIVEVNVNE